MVKFLFSRPDLDVRTGDPLRFALSHPRIASLLIAHPDFDPNAACPTPIAAIMLKEGIIDYAGYRRIADDPGTRTDDYLRQFYVGTPLELAIVRGGEAAVRALVDRGADVNAVHPYTEVTPLIAAVKSSTDLAGEAKVRVILSSPTRVDLTRRDRLGMTALEHAEQDRLNNIARIIRAYAAETNQTI